MASGQLFNLKWNNHTNNILQVFMEHLSCENLVDVTLSCQGQFLKAHKMILSACSPYFQELFNQHQHQQHPVIIINGMKFVDIKLVVEFMYRGEIKVLETELDGLLAAAEMLQVKGLSNVRNKYEKGDIHNAEPQGQQQAVPLSVVMPQADSPQSGQHSLETEVTGSPASQRRKRRRISDSPNRDGTGNSDTPNSHKNKDTGNKSAEAGEKERNPKLPSFVNVPMDDYMDEDLPATIKVEPPDIRDIDEEGCGSWEPPKLVIDMPDGKENSTKTESMSKSKSSTRGHKTTKGGSPSERANTRNADYSQAAGSSNDQEDKVLTAVQEQELELERRQACEWLRKRAGKIPRPPNAFMIFANEWRRKLAFEHPTESNKEISVRLGAMWKNLSAERKETYYAASRAADEEHKRKYPGYYYSPKEARLRKTLKQDLTMFSRKNPKAMEAMHLVKVLMADANESSSLLVNEPRKKERRKQNIQCKNDESGVDEEEHTVSKIDDDIDFTNELSEDMLQGEETSCHKTVIKTENGEEDKQDDDK
ncbi:protein tramtrack, beta isoform-like [Schistocerca nitens]|uniref:protein tramtrack, beta isoform-like n=1 Tax=Schistocerca nitens TaxID=7011 RepID=UPI002118C989|nr:protein tramtrack, beta isoform-like [Schistocerca nitens]XP_049791415.1 protein tramtrack, beta isoform-like [Schistocerca nitens]XP_049791416.1 protein tramtrack, beta isoform-like [Schistocerca nitens]XP_049791417.1 protein tramtrack, beta isoform-like [Schistocerca nitens]